MALYHLNYTVSIKTPIQQHLKVQLHIPSINPQTLDFFKGKLHITSFECSCPYTEYVDRYCITITHSSLTLSYTVAIGYSGKHGFQGGVHQELTFFSGDQAFLFPVSLLTSQNMIPSSSISHVQIDFDEDGAKHFILPFHEVKSDENVSYCKSPSWHHSYELMKSAYVLGDLEVLPISSDFLKIYIESCNQGIDATIIQNIENLYRYYSDLFGTTSHPLSLVLLSPSVQRLGGCGTHIVCSSFDPDSLRDWQLLAHRMFHSFMDAHLPLSDFHMPSQLWLTEGLATYYENMSLTHLTDSLKEALDLNIDKEFCRLFTRYLYGKLKPYSPFDFAPMSEKYIRAVGLLEFLHYTHAPLIIKYMQDCYCLSPDELIKTLKATTSHGSFSMEALFARLLGPDVNQFAQNYLFGNTILPLWALKDANIFTPDELISDLNYFEYILYSWLIRDIPGYQQTIIPDHIFDTLALETASLVIPYLDPPLTEPLKSYSPALYHLLKTMFS